MGKVVDLTGKRFGRLTVLRRDGVIYMSGNRRWSQPTWLCKCDCGTEFVTCGAYLRQGRTKSCGCLRREVTQQTGKNLKGKHWTQKRRKQYE